MYLLDPTVQAARAGLLIIIPYLQTRLATYNKGSGEAVGCEGEAISSGGPCYSVADFHFLLDFSDSILSSIVNIFPALTKDGGGVHLFYSRHRCYVLFNFTCNFEVVCDISNYCKISMHGS